MKNYCLMYLKSLGVGLIMQFLILMAILLPTAICFGHSEPPTPPPPPPRTTEAAKQKTERIYPLRWSWLHWWEANRDIYLKPQKQTHAQQEKQQTVAEKYRKKAVESLLAATESEFWQSRASAAMALGRMGENSACDTLVELASKDKSETVRIFATIALGLLNSQQGQTALMEIKVPRSSSGQRQAIIVALGLMDKWKPKITVRLKKALTRKLSDISWVSSWSLRCGPSRATSGVFKQVLRKSQNTWLVSDAILAMGTGSKSANSNLLRSILLANGRATKLPAWKYLEGQKKELLKIYQAYRARTIQYAGGRKAFRKTQRQWYRKSPNSLPDEKRKKGVTNLPMLYFGLAEIYQSRLRASAAIALGNCSSKGFANTAALIKALSISDKRYSDPYKGMVIMSLGKIGNPRGIAAVGKILNPISATRARKSTEKLESPLRGFAALAIGIYARPVETGQGSVDRPKYDKMGRLLFDRIMDPKETSEVKCASALGLGLTGRTANLPYLQKVAKLKGVKEDDALRGYILLARAMLGDSQIIEDADSFLVVSKDKTDPAGIIGRRAGVLALGVHGGQECIPILTRAWDLSYYVNREVTRAYSMCKAYNVTDPLVELLKDSKEPLEQAFAAQCLGELFSAKCPCRLSRLIVGGNYMMKNEKLRPFKAIANEFLYLYLIPCFGDEWR